MKSSFEGWCRKQQASNCFCLLSAHHAPGLHPVKEILIFIIVILIVNFNIIDKLLQEPTNSSVSATQTLMLQNIRDHQAWTHIQEILFTGRLHFSSTKKHSKSDKRTTKSRGITKRNIQRGKKDRCPIWPNCTLG